MISETAILQWLHLHPNLSGLATFIISAAESVAIIGTIVPGTVMMTAIGTLAGAGVIPLYPSIIWAILGAIVGDGISYWLGYYFKDHLRTMWPFKRNPQLLESGERFFYRYGSMSVLIGRFVGPVRALVPVVAGMLKMRPLRFTIANVISAIGWAPAYMFPGILLGAASLELPPDIAVHVILMFLLASLFVALCFWFVYKTILLISNQIDQLLSWIWQKLQRSRHFHIITTLLQHYNPDKLHGQLALAFYFIATGFLFLYLIVYLSYHPANTLAINNGFFYFFRGLRTPAGDNIALWISLLGDKIILFPVIFASIAWLLWKRCWHTALHLLALFGMVAGSIILFKYLTHSLRPWGVVIQKGSEIYSFPSGHTALATAFFAYLALLLIRAYHIKRRRLIYTLTGFVIAIVAISRLYLGVHWFTDIIGGCLLSITILMLTILSYNRTLESRTQLKNTSLITMAALLMMSTGYYCLNIDTLKSRYAQIDWPTYTVTSNNWWQQTDPHISLYRIGRVGIPAEILNLQWIGNLDHIKALLLKQGWVVPPERGWVDVLHRITDVSSTEHLPLVSPLYLDKKPVLVLTKTLSGNKKLIVLRLWNSHILIKNTKQPLWIGSIGFVPRTYSWLFHYKNKNIIINSSVLFGKSPAHYDLKEITVNNRLKNQPRTQQIILIREK